MDPSIVMASTGLALQTVTSVLQAYATFRKTSVETFFELLIQESPDMKGVEASDKLKSQFFSIIEKVSREFNQKKLESWKNATIHLATDFSKFDFNDCFIRTLNDITVFDLTVLQTIYSTDYPKESIQEDTIAYFEKRKVDPEIVWQSLKQLASHNLITEKFNRVGLFGDGHGRPHLEPLHYVKNSLGVDFLRFITTVRNVSPK